MRYHNISKDDMLNGPGLRVVLWTAGCDHKCKGCQNPITWNPNDGLEFDEAAKKELFIELVRERTTGITFSGGDPLHKCNINTTISLVKEIREKFPDKTIWVYTGGMYEDYLDTGLYKYIDCLVDGEYIEELRDISLPWIGSSNQRVINVKESLRKGEVVEFSLEDY